MKKTIKTEKKPIKLWLDHIEPEALQQARNIANLPFVFKHVALMPDCHQGFGMPIGGVMAAVNTVVPNAVGVDIGCGMSAVRSTLTEISRDALKAAMKSIRKRVPLGFKHHKQKQRWSGFDRAPDAGVVRQELKAASFQLGTLGGGNHFMEIQQGDDGCIWLMVHSGSRNFGLKIAREYHGRAKRYCSRIKASLPNADLSWLPLDHPDAIEYMQAMNFALDFARENRLRMMEVMKDALREAAAGVEFSRKGAVAGRGSTSGLHGSTNTDVHFDEIINIHHNYASIEKHFGHEVVVHRKGATSAREGQTGLIPGSQGTRSYVVVGLGNPESFMSCSHGAGRVMGRNQARKQLDFEAEKRRLDEQGIIHGIRHHRDLDEAAGAYKDIDQVMQDQRDLVNVLVELTPLAVIKG